VSDFLHDKSLDSQVRHLRRRLETTEVAVLSAKNMRSAFDEQRRQLNLMAAAVQRYLPSQYPLMGNLAISGHCRPCADLGGDFYDATELPDGRIALCMADVSGHGAVAAILMASSRALLRAALYESSPTDGPGLIMQRLSRWLASELLASEFLTMWLGLYDPATGVLRYASAAHPQAVLWQTGAPDPHFLDAQNTFPLGLAGLPPEVAREEQVVLEVGDRLFLYTDGWTESPSASGTLLEGDDLLNLFANSAGQSTDHTPIMLFTELERHLADSRIRDDVSLLVVDRLG
jgi:serine phosphatase RsbU (regulator of sigma subunit)